MAVVALAAALGLGLGPDAGGGQRASDGWQSSLLEQWLSAVERHDPGEPDTPLLAAAGWSSDDLHKLWIDVQVLFDIVKNPQHSRFRVQGLAYEATASLRNSTTYTFKPPDRAILDAFAKRVHAAGVNVVLRRAILLHTDSVWLAPDVVAASGGDRTARAPVKMLVGDGNSAGMEGLSLHWELARLAASAVTPDPRADPFVRDWYRATIAFGQSFESFDSAQLEHGLRLFPDDPQLLLMAGCEREAFASPLFQAFARAMNSRFMRVPFGSASGELEAAERFYRRAIEADGELGEAHVRLGRVLGLRGRHADASAALRGAVERGLDPVLEYYAMLFLAEVHESLGQLDSARAAYRRAADLTPGARIPHLQLARVARELGDADAVHESLQRALEPGADDKAIEPWWRYRSAQGRHAEEWLNHVRRSWGEPPP